MFLDGEKEEIFGVFLVVKKRSEGQICWFVAGFNPKFKILFLLVCNLTNNF